MPVFDIYSRRKRRAERGEPEVYQYDYLPQQLRNQVRHILAGVVGFDSSYWHNVHDQLLRELGVIYLCSQYYDPRTDVLEAITVYDANWLDIVDLCFFYVDQMRDLPNDSRRKRGIGDLDDAIEELNIRFRQAAFGYQFEGGQIVRVDSQLLHSEVVKPALVLLSDPRFEGAQDEFLSAHAHYRAGEYEDAIVDANRAFESTMKAICDINGWVSKGDRASDLVKVMRAEGLLPDYLDASFDQLIATLKSGLPQVRNEVASHGQGAMPRKTPGYVAGYALHLAAANIVLLVEALKESERE